MLVELNEGIFMALLENVLWERIVKVQRGVTPGTVAAELLM